MNENILKSDMHNNMFIKPKITTKTNPNNSPK